MDLRLTVIYEQNPDGTRKGSSSFLWKRTGRSIAKVVLPPVLGWGTCDTVCEG